MANIFVGNRIQHNNIKIEFICIKIITKSIYSILCKNHNIITEKLIIYLIYTYKLKTITKSIY